MVGGISNETLHAVVVNDMRSVTQRPLLLLGDTPEKLCPCRCPCPAVPAQQASEIETQLSALQVVVYLNQIVRTDVCCVRWEWRTLWMWNYVIIINKAVPRTRWRSLKVGHSVQTILQRPLIIMFQRARFLESLFFPDH